MTRFGHQVPGLSHSGGAPAVSQIGPLFVSSVISPMFPGMGTPADTPDAQARDLFTMIERHLAHAGVDWDDVAKLDFYLADPSAEDALDGAWAKQFPHVEMRPVRQIHIEPNLPPGHQLQATFLAYRES